MKVSRISLRPNGAGTRIGDGDMRVEFHQFVHIIEATISAPSPKRMAPARISVYLSMPEVRELTTGWLVAMGRKDIADLVMAAEKQYQARAK